MSYQVEKDSKIETENMPRVRSQDSLGVCFGCSSATIAQHYICKKENIPDCSKLPREKEISPLSAVAWANTNSEKGGVPELQNHTNIKFGGAGSLALFNAKKEFLFMADSCYPFDQFANRYGNNQDAVNSIISKLEGYYNKYKTEGSICEDCLLEDINKDLMTSVPASQLKLALNKATFGQFLYKIYFQRCPDLVNPSYSPTFDYFPKEKEKNTPSDMISKIKEVLSTKKVPLNIDGVCIESEGESCKTRHSVVISGYRKVCKVNNPKDCREVLKIQNCWGEDWQRRYDGGWVDAQALLGEKRGTGELSWYY